MINKNQHLIEHHAEQLARNEIYLNLSILVDEFFKLALMAEAYETERDDLFGKREVLEIYAVSEWLFKLLKDKGEPTVELLGLYLWGRCTSGQAIDMDGVITDIVLELWPEFNGIEEENHHDAA